MRSKQNYLKLWKYNLEVPCDFCNLLIKSEMLTLSDYILIMALIQLLNNLDHSLNNITRWLYFQLY